MLTEAIEEMPVKGRKWVAALFRPAVIALGAIVFVLAVARIPASALMAAVGYGVGRLIF